MSLIFWEGKFNRFIYLFLSLNYFLSLYCSVLYTVLLLLFYYIVLYSLYTVYFSLFFFKKHKQQNSKSVFSNLLAVNILFTICLILYAFLLRATNFGQILIFIMPLRKIYNPAHLFFFLINFILTYTLLLRFPLFFSHF